MTDKFDGMPGRWGYLCGSASSRCPGGIAFAFVGEDFAGYSEPNATMYLEDLELTQRGAIRSKRRSQIVCQHCGIAVPLQDGKLRAQNVVEIDEWIAAQNEKRQRAREKGGRSRGRARLGNFRPDLTREGLGVGYRPEEAKDAPAPKPRKKKASRPQKPSPEAEARTKPAPEGFDYGAARAGLDKEPKDSEIPPGTKNTGTAPKAADLAAARRDLG